MIYIKFKIIDKNGVFVWSSEVSTNSLAYVPLETTIQPMNTLNAHEVVTIELWAKGNSQSHFYRSVTVHQVDANIVTNIKKSDHTTTEHRFDEREFGTSLNYGKIEEWRFFREYDWFRVGVEAKVVDVI